MSVTIVYQTTCRCYESFEASIMQSLAFIADFFAVASFATKASTVGMSDNYEEAKRIIETLKICCCFASSRPNIMLYDCGNRDRGLTRF